MAQGDNWNELLKEVVTFDSVEEFWGVYVRPTLRLLALLRIKSFRLDRLFRYSADGRTVYDLLDHC